MEGSVMVWGCMSALELETHFYRWNYGQTCNLSILKENLNESANKMGLPAEPRPQPDRKLVGLFGGKIREHNISLEDMLKQALLQEWEKIPEEMCRILVESMPRRLTAVCNNNGYGTKY
ncbi:hypothetical protein EVAR_101513_1 [Eumeta japonica]|uniref:Uncharacterized protein n=1 Tax=Eumeta variegata TaxID=151549 RepID=A0A4C1TNY0_EUMVA|nr:hypothetical protein EVAR_101513_1 [Eumeta japonica]